jgi:thiamine transport system permease protein
VVRPDARLRRAGARRQRLALPAVLFIGAFFGLPVSRIIARGLSGGALVDLFTDRSLGRVAWFTLWQAALSTLATLVASLPITFVLARYRFPGRRAVESLLIIPFVLPTVVVGAAFLALLPSSLKRSILAIVVAHVFFNVAVVARTVVPLWRQLDRRLGNAAATLGASPFTVARTITWPLLRPAYGAATAVVFLFSFTSFGIVQLLGGPARRTIEVEVYRRTAQLLDLRSAAALAFVQLLALTTALTFVSRRSNRQPARSTAADADLPTRPRLLVLTLVGTGAFFTAPLIALAQRAGQWTSLFDDSARAALWLSLRTAGISATIATALGVLASLSIAERGRWRAALDIAVVLPLGTSAVTIGFGLLITYNRDWYDLRGNALMVPIAHALIGLPFVVRTVTPVLRALNPRQRDAAATLGASPFAVWRTIEFPRMRRALAAGFGFAAAVSLGEFGASSFLARRTGPTLPILIGELLGRPGAANRERAYALAVLLAAVTAAIMFSVDRLATETR